VIDLTPFFGIGLLLVRPGALILAAPTLGGTYAPAQVKIGLTVFIAILLLPTTEVPAVPSAMGMAAVVARETAIGLAFALAIRVLVTAAEFAGHLAGSQMGLSYAATVDPSSGARHTSIATLYGNITMVVFLATNAHHVFLRALGDSYVRLPISAGQIGPSLPDAVTSLLGLTFTMAVRLAAPFIIVLAIVEVAMALVTKAAPALNLIVLGAPVRVLVGLVIIGLVVPAVVGIVGGMSTNVAQLGIRAAEAFR
jgi:flagellar biosynthesis protein FliR